MATSSLIVTVSGYRNLMTDLRKIEPGLLKEMRRDVRKIGNPLRNSIRNNIPKTSPISHMTSKVGRLSWEVNERQNVEPSKTVLDTRKPTRKTKAGTSLVKIRVSSPGVVMADMAGRSGKYIGQKPMAASTKKNAYVIERGKYKGQLGYAYRYPGSTNIEGRRHRNTGGQGRGMIRNLGTRGSRYVYPAVERSLPAARFEIHKIVQNYVAEVNRSKR